LSRRKVEINRKHTFLDEIKKLYRETNNVKLKVVGRNPEQGGILLLHPPLWKNVYGPHLAIPQLAGFLESKGVKVWAKDVNISVFNTMLRTDVLPIFWDQCVKLAQGALEGGNLNIDEQKYLHKRIQEAMSLMSLLTIVSREGKCRLYKWCEGEAWYAKLEAFTSVLFNLCNLYFYGHMHLAEEVDLSDENTLSRFREFYQAYVLPTLPLDSVHIIGISVSSLNQLVPALALVQVIQAYQPSATLVLGGALFSIIEERHIEYILKHFPVKVIVLYEGEQVMLDLFEGKVPTIISNCRTLKDNVMVRGPARCILIPIRNMPGPSYSGFYPEDYFFMGGWHLPLLQSRGCYWGRCVYCNFTKLSFASRYEEKPIDKFIEEIENLKCDRKKTFLSFINDSISPRFCQEFSEAVLMRGLKIRWETFLRADKQFSDPLLRLMQKAGLTYVFLGAESLEDRVLKTMNKGNSSEDVKNMIRRFVDLRLHAQVNIILDLPTTTYEEARRTVEFLLANTDPNIIAIGLFFFSLVNRSGIADNPRAYGLKVLPNERGPSVVSTSTPYISETGMTQEEKYEVLKIYRNLMGRHHLPDLD